MKLKLSEKIKRLEARIKVLEEKLNIYESYTDQIEFTEEDTEKLNLL